MRKPKPKDSPPPCKDELYTRAYLSRNDWKLVRSRIAFLPGHLVLVDHPMSEIRTRIYTVVESIPHGSVVTYGQVAAMAGAPRHARQVGYALHDLPEGSPLPWHRVVNAKGEISQRREPGCDEVQRTKLEAEGIEFHKGRVDLDRYRWEPDDKPGKFRKP